MRLAVAAGVGALALGLAGDAHAGACDVVERAAPKRLGSGMFRAPLFIGDSSMLLGVPAMARLGFQADARGCRQASAAMDVLAQHRKRRRVRLAVVGVGANGPAPWPTLRRGLRLLRPGGVLGLVAGTSATGAPATMRRFARRHPRRTVLIDWQRTNPHRYGGDGIHIGVRGETAEARFIHRHVRHLMPPPRRLARRVPPTASGSLDCGVMRRGRRRLQVFVVFGASRVTCERALEVMDRRLERPEPRWRAWDWEVAGRGRFTDVVARHDLRVVVAARRPLREPAAPAQPGEQPGEQQDQPAAGEGG